MPQCWPPLLCRQLQIVIRGWRKQFQLLPCLQPLLAIFLLGGEKSRYAARPRSAPKNSLIEKDRPESRC